MSDDTALWVSCLTCGATMEPIAGADDGEEWRDYCSPGCYPGPGHLTLPELVEELDILIYCRQPDDPVTIAKRLGVGHNMLLIRLDRNAGQVGEFPRGRTRAQVEAERAELAARIEWRRRKVDRDLRAQLARLDRMIANDDARQQCARLHAKMSRERWT